MAPINYQARKKTMELEIVKMVYPDAEKYIKSIDQEQPDFLVAGLQKKVVFGIEVTELYQNESSARLKHIPGYVDALVERREYRHKDDVNRLKPDEFEILDEAGNVKHTLKGVMQTLPSLTEYLRLLAESIAEKTKKLSQYAPEARYHALLIYDREAYFGGVPLTDLYAAMFSPEIEQVLDRSGFREIYLVGQMDQQDRYIPLKSYQLYAALQQFEQFFLPTYTDGISVRKYIETTIAVLAQTGFGNACVHQAENFISLSYGDLSMKIDLVDQSGSVFFPTQYLDYSDGSKAAAFAASYPVDPAVVEGFRQYRTNYSFHSTFAFPWSK